MQILLPSPSERWAGWSARVVSPLWEQGAKSQQKLKICWWGRVICAHLCSSLERAEGILFLLIKKKKKASWICILSLRRDHPYLCVFLVVVYVLKPALESIPWPPHPWGCRPGRHDLLPLFKWGAGPRPHPALWLLVCCSFCCFLDSLMLKPLSWGLGLQLHWQPSLPWMTFPARVHGVNSLARNKVSQTGWLRATGMRALEVGGPKSKCQKGWLLVKVWTKICSRPFSLASRRLSSHCVSSPHFPLVYACLSWGPSCPFL